MISKNAIAIVLLALSMLGVNVAEEQLIEVLGAIGTVVSFALMIWNQWDRKDVDWFFWKK